MRETLTKPSSNSSEPQQKQARQSLKLIKIILLVFALGICVVGKTKMTWPVVAWTLYSGYSPRFRPPEPSVSIMELRVSTTSGERLIIKPEQILSLPRDSLSHEIVEQAFKDTESELRTESRKYLLNAVSKYINTNSEIEAIQGWQLTYKIEPTTVPPIQRQAPDQEVMLGSFAAENYLASDRQ